MVTFSVKRVFPLLSALVCLAVVNSSPTHVCSNDVYTDLTGDQVSFELSVPHAKNAAPAPPHFVIYGDKFVAGQTGPPPVEDVKVSSPKVVVDHHYSNHILNKGFQCFVRLLPQF